MADLGGWARGAARLVPALLAASVASGCSLDVGFGGDDPEEPPTPAAGPLDFVERTSCPAEGTTPSIAVPFEPLDDGSPEIDAMIATFSDGRQTCVEGNAWELPEGALMTQYTVTARGPGIYEQSSTTRDADGGDELLNFPFHFNRYGRCVTVTATLTLSDPAGKRLRYRAVSEVGPRC